MIRRAFVAASLALTPGLLIFAETLTTMEKVIKKNLPGAVRLKMAYNNIGQASGLIQEKGLSVWLETGDYRLLFDTGGDAAILGSNMVSAGLDPALLTTVVISHDHWDHRNGLDRVLKGASLIPEVLVPREVETQYADQHPGARIRGISAPEEIAPGIWTTGTLPAIYKGNPISEQSLAIVRGSRILLLTGCSHPGIVTMVRKVNQLFPGKRIALVAGGLHLNQKTVDEILEISELLRQEGVEKVAPSHCTGETAISLFRKEWGKDFTEFNLGDELAFP